MLYVVAIVLVFLAFSLGSLAQKMHGTRMGRGIGKFNTADWGMEEAQREYHE